MKKLISITVTLLILFSCKNSSDISSESSADTTNQSKTKAVTHDFY